MYSNGTIGDVMPADTASNKQLTWVSMTSHWEYFEALSTEAIQNRPRSDLVYIAERTLNTNIPTQLNA